jgi:hypothetical protein
MKQKKIVFLVLAVHGLWAHVQFDECPEANVSPENHLLFQIKKKKKRPIQKDRNFTKKNAVIPSYSGGRFGDNLLAFSHAAFFAWKNNYKLFLVPFKYSDQLTLYERFPLFSREIERRFKNQITYPGGDVKINGSLMSTLITIPYFPDAIIEYTTQRWSSFKVDWEDDEFKQKLRKWISPREPLSLIEPPRDKISVAVHLRKGGGFDDMSLIYQGTLIYKMPLDEFYIEQIKKISEILDGAPLYVFLFTDDPHPEHIASLYGELINLPSIEFDYRRENNSHLNNVLEDFFSMTQFDILIRPDSNYSIMAEKIADYYLVVSPGAFTKNAWVQTGLFNFKRPLSLLKQKGSYHAAE